MEANDNLKQLPKFQVLSNEQIHKIYEATLHCLQRTGVEVRNQEARDLLADAGAQVDGLRVRIPPHIIQETLSTTPSNLTIWGRNKAHRMKVEFGRTYFGPGPSCTYFIDPETGARRKTRKGDPAKTAQLCDALDNIDYVMSLGLIGDVTPSLAPVYEFAEMITHTSKPVIAWAFNLEQLKDIHRIALTLAEGEEDFRKHPNFGFFSTWQAPLIHTNEDMANCLWAVDHGIPVIYSGGGIAGISAPVTGPGLLVVNLAGMLSGVAIFQLKKPGAPVCAGGMPASMNLQTARPNYGGPELSVYSAAISEITRRLGVPFMGTAGASEAKVVDLQAAIDSTIQVLLSSLSRSPLVHDVGFLDCADIGSLEMLILNDEIISLTKKIMHPIDVNDDTLMLDLIDEIGPGGEFISSETTARLCRQEIWISRLMDSDPWAIWAENGSLSILDRINHRLQGILDNHRPSKLPEGVTAKIGAILNEAEARTR
jgi:trimethylamine--corrinoid protein Co-methyltransferase